MSIQLLVLDSLAGIWPHSLMVMKVIEQLQPTEVKVDYVSCGSAAPAFCTVQESRAQKFIEGKGTKPSTCRDCKFTAKMNASRLYRSGLSDMNVPIFLSQLVDAELLQKEQAFLGSLSREIPSILDIEIAKTPVVRMALYESILKFKKKDLNFNSNEYGYFLAVLSNAVRFALLGEKFFSTNKKYDALLVYAPQYAINNAFVHKALEHGTKVLFVDGNGNLAEKNSSVVVWNWDKFRLQKPGLSAWQKNSAKKLSQGDESRLKEHRKQLSDGRSFSVYSARSSTSHDLFKFFNLSPKNRIWTLALSSLDEVFAAQIIRGYPDSKYPGQVFRDQYEWVRETIEWVRGEKNVNLVIRMHPRDLPNKRENVKSEQAEVWESMLRNLPENVSLNHPSDGVAISDLLAISDGFLTGWSSTALEAMELGIPVVTYDANLPGYPSDIHLTGFSKESYLNNLLLLKNTPKSKEISKQARLWMSFLFNRGSAQLTGRLFERSRLVGPRIISKALNALDLFFPYVLRPFEASIVIRRTHEGERVKDLIMNNLDSFYEIDTRPSPIKAKERK